MEKKKTKQNLDKIALKLALWSKRWVKKNWPGPHVGGLFEGQDNVSLAIYLIVGTAEASEGFLQNYYPMSSAKHDLIMKKAVKLLKEKKV